MVKDSRKYAATRGWGLAQFKNGKPDSGPCPKPASPTTSPSKLVTLSSPITHPDTRESHEDGRIVLEFNHEDQIHLAEWESSAFIGAVTQLFGPEEAKLSVEDWLDELELVDSTSLDKSRSAGGFGQLPRDWQSG
jgi:hypothetical protein